jgi:hypothetical protein
MKALMSLKYSFFRRELINAMVKLKAMKIIVMNRIMGAMVFSLPGFHLS